MMTAVEAASSASRAAPEGAFSAYHMTLASTSAAPTAIMPSATCVSQQAAQLDLTENAYPGSHTAQSGPEYPCAHCTATPCPTGMHASGVKQGKTWSPAVKLALARKEDVCSSTGAV